MHINDEKLELLISNQFVIDCIHIELTQQTENDSIIYAGSGSIFQKADGNFHLKLYHSFKDLPKELMPSFSDVKPGKIIGSEQYFSMQATDMSGNVWLAENISVSRGFSLPATGKIVSTTIRSLKCVKQRKYTENKQSSYLFFVLPGKQNIPCNKWEDLPSGESSLNTAELKVFGTLIEIKDKKNCLTVMAEDLSGNMDDSFMHRLVEALSIVFGKLCPVLYSSFAAKDESTSTINSIPIKVPNEKMESPIKHYLPQEIESFIEFIDHYMHCFQTKHDIFYGYWHKINRSWQGGIENAALTISTAIEGITKNYYSEYGFPDEEIITQAESAKSVVRCLEIGKIIKSRLLSSIGQVKSSNPKNALYNLVKEGKLDNSLVEGWVSLRNKSAHADNLDKGIEELQKYIDDVYKCLNLFNVLLLIKINFTGKYQDFSKDGWVESSLT